MQLLEIETLRHWQRASASSLQRPAAGISKSELPILFVDSRVELSPSTLHSIPANTIGVNLSRTLDGILQITGVLQYLHAIDSIYIVGFREGDCFWLGNACIRANSLHRYHKYLATWHECHSLEQVPIWLCGDSAMIQTMAIASSGPNGLDLGRLEESDKFSGMAQKFAVFRSLSHALAKQRKSRAASNLGPGSMARHR